MTAYKRIDLAVATMKQLNRRLVVIGDGTERDYIESLAGPNTEFLGRVSFDTIREKMGSARALLFPGIEDFGITPVEAQAAGCPVIAYRGGGALETVVDNVTGVFFNEQTPESLCEAIERFEALRILPSDCRAQSERFSSERFTREFRAFIQSVIANDLDSESHTIEESAARFAATH
jgi:glycosyltransferase involved in cell wall biosynthesis